MIGFALALFYPTLTFLSGLINVTLATILSLAVISALVVTFLGLTVGWRQTWWRAGILLLIFLGIFSLGMLSPWRRLLTTGGGLLLVGTFMMAYARREIPPEPEPKTGLESVKEPEPESEPAIMPVSPEESLEEPYIPEPSRAHCPQCGRDRAEDYAFCPGCGYDTQNLIRCKNCGYEQHIDPEIEKAFCLHCGEPLQ